MSREHKWFADGPEGHFFADDHALAEKLIAGAGFDRDDWTITDISALTAPAQAGDGEAETQGGDWYTRTDTGSVCIDWDADPKRQLSLICKRDGTVGFAAYIDGERVRGPDAMVPEFFDVLRRLATPPPSAAPQAAGDGFVLVPREPTPEMREAGRNAHFEVEEAVLAGDNGWTLFGLRANRAAHVYSAMLAAAPSAAPAVVGEAVGHITHAAARTLTRHQGLRYLETTIFAKPQAGGQSVPIYLAATPAAPEASTSQEAGFDALALIDSARREFRDSDAAGDVLDWLEEAYAKAVTHPTPQPAAGVDEAAVERGIAAAEPFDLYINPERMRVILTAALAPPAQEGGE
jgi:hypothetical protein